MFGTVRFVRFGIKKYEKCLECYPKLKYRNFRFRFERFASYRDFKIS